MKNERCNLKKIIKINEKFAKTIVILVALNFLMGFYYDNGLSQKMERFTVEIGEFISEEKIKSMTSLLDENLTFEDNVPKNNIGQTNKVGVFHYYLVYVDKERKYSKVINQSEVEVIDTVKPEIILKSDEFTFKYDSQVKPSDIAKCVDLSECELSFLEKVDTKKSGTQKVTIVARDEGENESTKEVEIKILEKPVYRPVFNYYYNYGSIGNMNNHNNEINSALSPEEKESMREQVIAYAKRFVGNPYVMRGNSLTKGTDCSGFTQSVYANFDYWVPRASTSQAYIGYQVKESELLPGDIVVYHYGNTVGGHVGLYLGNGMMVHAGTPETGIIIAPMFAGYRTYRRIIM